MKVIPKGKLGHYPIALIPGQFVDYYEKFTPEQLKYLPLNTTLKMPPPNTRYAVLHKRRNFVIPKICPISSLFLSLVSFTCILDSKI